MAAVTYAGVLLFLFAIQDYFIFHPSKVVEIDPARLGIPYEDVSLRTIDGETLAGWFVPAEEPRATVLFLHGNAGNRAHRLHALKGLPEAGLSVLIIDYRGYGESTGSPGEEGLQRDARAAWDHLTRERGLFPGEIVLYGESLGSAPALYLAARLEREGKGGPAAVILEGAFTSALEMGKRSFPFLPVSWVLRSRFDNLSLIREVTAPTLIIHARRDEIVPIEMARRLHEASASVMKDLREVEPGGHNTLWMEGARELYTEIGGFVGRVARRRAVAPDEGRTD